MGCQQGKPMSCQDLTKKRKSSQFQTSYENKRMSSYQQRSKKSETSMGQIDYTLTLKQLENMREGLQKPVITQTKPSTHSLIETKNQKIIQGHHSGVIISFENSKLFQRRKTKLSTNSTNVSISFKAS